MRLFIALSFAVMVTACQDAPPEPAKPETNATGRTSETDPQAPSVPAPATIIGSYRVAEAGGNPSDGIGWGMGVIVTAQRIKLSSQCVTPEWDYSYAGGALRTEPVPKPICERAYLPVEQAAMQALDHAQDVTRMQDGAVVLSGSGHSITLVPQ